MNGAADGGRGGEGAAPEEEGTPPLPVAAAARSVRGTGEAEGDGWDSGRGSGRGPTATIGHRNIGGEGLLLLMSLPPPRWPLLLRLTARGWRHRDIRHGGVIIAVATVRLRPLLSEGNIDDAKLLDESVTGGQCHLPHPRPRLGILELRVCPEDGPWPTS